MGCQKRSLAVTYTSWLPHALGGVGVPAAVLLSQGRGRRALSPACGVFLSLPGTGIAGLVPAGWDGQAGKSLPALWSPAVWSPGLWRCSAKAGTAGARRER